MRFFITLIALCFASYTFAAQGTCAKDSLCQGCTNDATTCFSCYNYKGKINPKQFASNACATDVANTVTDCKYYKNTITSTKSKDDCTMCNAKKWLNITDNATASSIVIGCSDTALDATTCAVLVANCDQSACFKNTSNAYTKLCAQCSTGYKGSGSLTASVGYPSCVNTSIISNCSIANPVDNTKCKVCATNFAVSSANDTSCTSFTTDANCRKLGGATWCSECKDGYYFDGKGVCLMGASIMMFSSAILSLLVFFN